MRDIVHPLAEELGGLVEEEKPSSPSGDDEPDRDTSWRWMVAIALVVGLFAWFTR